MDESAPLSAVSIRTVSIKHLRWSEQTNSQRWAHTEPYCYGQTTRWFREDKILHWEPLLDDTGRQVGLTITVPTSALEDRDWSDWQIGQVGGVPCFVPNARAGACAPAVTAAA